MLVRRAKFLAVMRLFPISQRGVCSTLFPRIITYTYTYLYFITHKEQNKERIDQNRQGMVG